MTDITELAQSLKAAAEKWQEAWGKYDKVEITIAEFIRAANQYESIVEDPANILVLVEALEKAQQRIGKLEKKLTDHKRMNQEMAKAMLTPNDSDAAGMEIAALRQRIAELESRTVKLPNQIEFDDPLSAYEAINKCKEALAAEGIKWEAE